MAPQLNLACPLELSRDPIDLGIKEFLDEYDESPTAFQMLSFFLVGVSISKVIL